MEPTPHPTRCLCSNIFNASSAKTSHETEWEQDYLSKETRRGLKLKPTGWWSLREEWLWRTEDQTVRETKDAEKYATDDGSIHRSITTHSLSAWETKSERQNVRLSFGLHHQPRLPITNQTTLIQPLSTNKFDFQHYRDLNTPRNGADRTLTLTDFLNICTSKVKFSFLHLNLFLIFKKKHFWIMNIVFIILIINNFTFHS